jgi:hypothetical protein
MEVRRSNSQEFGIVELGDAGIGWVRRVLDLSGGELSRRALASLDLSRGKARTVLASRVAQRPLDFDGGIILEPGEWGRMRAEAIKLVRAAGRVLVLEDTMDSPTTAASPSLPEHAFLLGRTICYWKDLRSASAADIDGFLKENGLHNMTAAFLLDLPAPSDSRGGLRDVDAILDATRGVVVDAYDSEGYVLWTPK